MRLLRRTQDAYPGDFWSNQFLGIALLTSQPPQFVEACRFLTAAVALRPRSPGALLNLGTALYNQNRHDDAAVVFRKIIDCKPDYARGHFNLGIVLRAQGKNTDAEPNFRRATELEPGYAPAHYSLGCVLLERWELPGAESHLRRAIQLEPGYLPAHFHLGSVLERRGDLAGAVACYRRVIALAPKYAEGHCNLGHVLLRQGDLQAALKAFQTGHDLRPRGKDWPYPSEEWIERCQRLLVLEGRLPAILKGEDRLASTAERIDLADLCRYKRLYASSVRFYIEAFDADRKLADDLLNHHRFWAACSAALAGCGKGEEAPRLDEVERARLRKQALVWLRANLVGWGRHLASGIPVYREGVQVVLRGWRTEPALAGVRDAGRLPGLPAEERAAWRQFWADVAALMAKAREGK
jgi:tetratricopeptide (TPR) repeat protein